MKLTSIPGLHRNCGTETGPAAFLNLRSFILLLLVTAIVSLPVVSADISKSIFTTIKPGSDAAGVPKTGKSSATKPVSALVREARLLEANQQAGFSRQAFTPQAAFTPGNLVVMRFGDGSLALTANATPAFLDEYTTAGVLVQTVALPTTTSGANRRMTVSGTATSEGELALSVDGRYLTAIGYDAAVGMANITTSASAAVNRVIARVDGSAAIDTTTALTDGSTGSNPRGAVSTDGTNLWMDGGAGGSRFTTLGATTSTQLSTSVTNLRHTNIFGGQLYVSSASGAFRLATVGAGTPTTSGQPILQLPGVPTTLSSPYGFFFADLNAGVAGVDTLYIADDNTGATGGILKFSLVSGSWVSNGSVTSTAGVRGLTGKVTGSSVTLYAGSSGSLVTITDNSGYNATITGSISSLATPGTNKQFRGVAFAPASSTTNPSGVGAANPNTVAPGDPTLLTVTVTPGTIPTSTGINVLGDLSLIGGSPTQTFFDDGTHGDVTPGDNIFSVSTTPTIATSGGLKNLPFFIVDGQARTGNGTIALTVIASTNPSGVGSAVPTPVAAGQSTLLKVTVTPGTNPASTLLAVSADLSSIGGSTTQQFFDDGTNGDVTNGDNIFSFNASVPIATSTGPKTLPFTISDAQMRTGTGNISLTVSAPSVPPGTIVISQLYGGGGNAGATLKNDYIELFNRSQSAVDITGWSLQRQTAAGGQAWTSNTFLSGVIQPGQYFLVQEAAGAGGSVNLPTPDATGTLTLGAGTGIIALVNNSTLLAANVCPNIGSNLIDLIGYGTGTVCFETAVAPDLGNTTAALRTHGGCKDTDNNSVDFKVASPAPRNSSSSLNVCTAGDLAPEVFTTTPDDASTSNPINTPITVTFDEPVNVTASWFTISCANSGSHTAGFSGGPTTFTITPDVAFGFLEQCTVTLLANQVTDQDAIDPPDNMVSNYVFSFLTASDGTEHLLFGNPSGATSDPINFFDNYLMTKSQYALSYSGTKGTPIWTSWHLDSTWLGSAPRQDDFRNDTSLPPNFYQVLGTDYSGSGFDRGHSCPSADRTSSIPDNSATFLMTNMTPQAPFNNQGPFEDLESYLRTQVTAGNELYIVSGPAGVGGTGSGGFHTTIAGGHVTVPAFSWKVALILPVGTNDVSRVTTSTRAVAIIIPNNQTTVALADPWQKYITTVRNVENLTGFNFFSAVPQNIQDVIENRIDPLNAPAVAVFGSKTVTGTFTPGSAVTYTVVLNNAGNSTQPDNTGNEFTDVLPAGLTLVSASANNGTAFANTGTNTVTWNGPILSAGSVTITINATIPASATAGTVISNQGTIAFDSEANGSNESSALTDDPNVVGVSNTTDFTVVNPIPAISTLSPTSAQQNSSGGTVTISGSNFYSGSVVRYDGADHSTNFVNDTTLTITLAAADTATTGAKIVAVFNAAPGGGLSNRLLFTITTGNVSAAQTIDVPANNSGTESVMGATANDPSLTATLTRSGAGPADTDVYVAEYTGNPTGTNIFDVGGGFLDLQVTNAGPNDSLTAKFYYPATITGQTETDLKLFFYNGTNWQAIKSSGGVDPVKDTTDNLDGTTSGGRITVVFDGTSTPQLSQLTGTVITMSTVSTPTAVDFDSARVVRVGNSVVVQWSTGNEVSNLGFNVYRQDGGDRVQVNPSLIAGTALMVGSDVKVQSGYTYNWTDDAPNSKVGYWIESIDLDGTSQWHGPFGVSSGYSGPIGRTRSALLNNLNGSTARQTNAVIIREYAAGFANSSTFGSAVQTNGRTPTKPTSVSASLQKQWQVAAQAAVKLGINKTGWYRVNASDLMAAGMNANASPAALQMFVGGVEVPIRVNSADGQRLAPTDSIEFYGVAMDTTTTDTQVYWLTSGLGTGKRINVQLSPGSSSGNPNSFQYTIERKDRSLYFSNLRNGDAENWFGSLVSTSQVLESINIHNHDANAVGQAQIEIALQGVTANAHQVNVSLNGQALNQMTFAGQEHPVLKLSVPESFLVEGENKIAFAAAASGDVSLVDYVRITYAHTYTAENNALSTSVTGAQPIKVTGFTSNQIRAIDVANASQPIQLEGTIAGDAGNYSISVDGAKRRNLLVFTPDRVLQPLSITANQPSTLSNAGNGADFVIITSRNFAQSVQPLADLRQSQGYKVKVVDIDSVYDDFSYGVHSPYAVRDFLNWTYTHWEKQPQFVMLAGSGTLDPRNYTGVGFMDFVPTKLIDTSSMETASDDWFVDFNNDGKPQMSIGRLPANSVAEANLIINKIIAYEHSDAVQAMVLVSDLNDGINFSSSNNQIKTTVPSGLSVVNINRDQSDARATLLNQFDQSGRIINYVGHGSVNLWRGGLLTAADMASLANRKTSPLVVTMTCLNGYFQDPKLESLGESLLKVNNGGAVSVWASSGMTDSRTQTAMNQEFFRQLFGSTTITLGEAIRAAKAATFDNDVRRTWILLGDPTMRIKRN